MRKLCYSLLLALTLFAVVAPAQTEIPQAAQLSKVLVENFSTFNRWMTPCSTQLVISSLICNVRVKSRISLMSCEASGLNNKGITDDVAIDDAEKIVKAIGNSGVVFKDAVGFKNLVCESDFAGLNSCGIAIDKTTCKADEIVTR